MIDSHCHLEQKGYVRILHELIPRWKEKLKLIITCCAHYKDFSRTLEIVDQNKGFIFCTLGLHPEFIKEIENTKERYLQKKKYIEEIRKAKPIAIGEVGLDYHWIKEPEWQDKQKDMFIEFISLAKEMNLPLVIHSWDATEDAIKILEEEGMKAKKVLFHLLQDKDCLSKIIENNWFISIGPGIAKSKTIKKIARDCPLNRILLETDSPWFKQEGQEFGEPINVKVACGKIAEIKKISIEEVEKQTDLNAIEFFNLK